MENEPVRKPRQRVEVKLTNSEKELIASAASVAKQSLAEFIREAAKRAAQDKVK